MSDLIDRQAAIKALEKWFYDVFGIRESDGTATIFKRLRGLPTIEERKTGKWIHNPDPMAGEGYWNCSECGLNVYTCTDYCPHCGSEMR